MLITNNKEKVKEVIESCIWGENLAEVYKFIDDPFNYDELCKSYYKEVRLNLYNLSNEKAKIYIHELIADLNVIALNQRDEEKKKLQKDYSNNLLTLPESGAKKIKLNFIPNYEDNNEEKSKKKEISIREAIFLLLIDFRESLIEVLGSFCEDFNLPFIFRYDENRVAELQFNSKHANFLKEVNDTVNDNQSFQDFTESSKMEIKWKGTPGEFGAIFNLLIDNGFIELIKDKKNMVRLLHTHFDIKNKEGFSIDTDYLYKCFKDKIKNYPPNYLKIPFSDNYHNDK